MIKSIEEKTRRITNELIMESISTNFTHTRSKMPDRAIIIHATRSSEHKSNFIFQVSIRRVYENSHRVSEYVTLQYGESKSINTDMENHSYLNHSKQNTEIVNAHVLHLKSSFLHMTRERCPSLGSQRVSQ
jgi:hypothetical protein